MELNLNLFYDATPVENTKTVETGVLETYDYIVGEKNDWFSSRKQAIVQASVIEEYPDIHFTYHTFVLENQNDECYVRFWIPLFNDFNKFFKPNLPIEILNKFPHLKIMANPYEYSPRREFNEFGPELTLMVDLTFIGPRENDFINSFEDNARFVFTTKAIKGDTITREQANDIFFAHKFIKHAIKEYKSFQKSRLYNVLKRKSEEPITFKDFFNGISVLTIFRMCKLAYSLYTGITSNDDVTGWGNLSNEVSLDQLSDSDMTDYVCADYTEGENNDISFTGNDKYTDNSYNQAQADKWLAKEQDCLAKGDKSGAAAAHATAMDHLKRIKS